MNFNGSIVLQFNYIIWATPSEFGTYRLCEQRRFRRACASAQSRQNLRCSLIQAVNQEEPLDRKPDPWPLWMAGHAQLKFVMTECSKTQIRLSRPISLFVSKWYILCTSFFQVNSGIVLITVMFPSILTDTSVDPDQTAEGADSSGYALFAIL